VNMSLRQRALVTELLQDLTDSPQRHRIQAVAFTADAEKDPRAEGVGLTGRER